MKMEIHRTANFSECLKYRYSLNRLWDDSKPQAMCIGLNPSTANHLTDDLTIRMLILHLPALGFGGFVMCNLYGLISSDPDKLWDVPDPQGDNDRWLRTCAADRTIIFCWGNFKGIDARARLVREMFPVAFCFGKNKNGTPLHPRRLQYGITPGSYQLQRYTHG